MKTLFAVLFAFVSLGVHAEQSPVEIHDQLAAQPESSKKIALTLDACGGKYDEDLINFLIKNQYSGDDFCHQEMAGSKSASHRGYQGAS